MHKIMNLLFIVI